MSVSQAGLNCYLLPNSSFFICKGKSRIYAHLISQIGSKEQMTYYTHEGWKTFQHGKSSYHHEDGGTVMTQMESLLFPGRGWLSGLLGDHLHGIHCLRTGVNSDQSLW